MVKEGWIIFSSFYSQEKKPLGLCGLNHWNLQIHSFPICETNGLCCFNHLKFRLALDDWLIDYIFMIAFESVWINFVSRCALSQLPLVKYYANAYIFITACFIYFFFCLFVLLHLSDHTKTKRLVLWCALTPN